MVTARPQGPFRLCYLAFVRLPTEKAHGAQIVKTCEALADEGIEVSLLVPGRKTPITEDPFTYYGAQKNFVLMEVPTPDFVRFGPLGFMLSLFLFAEAARFTRAFDEADVVYSRDAGVLLQYVLLRHRFVYEAHTRPTFVSRLVARRAAKVVAISQGLKDAYVCAGVRKECIIVAHDAIDPAPFKIAFDQNVVRAEYGIPTDKKVALYVGKIDDAKGVPAFAEASEHLPENVRAVVIGAGTQKDTLAARFPRALFLSSTPYRDLAKVLSAADVLVLPNSAKDTDASRYTSPLKAFAYLASGKPIVATDVPALRELLDGAAVFAQPDDAPSLAHAITRAIATPSVPANKDYSWRARAKTILSAIRV